ncbi:hypothetical protein ACEWY4_027464 [Coilia grayii]|uniref:Uncharacterized protein n=1 Tax=Coilia grayii TaxID=363190 RepID=A0ABD1IRT3_9TELE
MAQSKEVTSFSSAISPKFTTDLLPAAERTALLFHLSYLYLAGYPDLEKLIRERALNARLLFVSSERVMFKCLCTSDNLVKSLFPILKVAVQKNKTEIAKTYLAKAQGWISEIVKAADEMVKGYKNENKALSDSTSTIYEKKTEKQNMTVEMKNLKQQQEALKEKLKKITSDQSTKQQEINAATSTRNSHISHMGACDREFAARHTFSFGFFSWRKGPSDSTVAQTHDTNRNILNKLDQDLQKHMSDMDQLKREEQQVHNEMMEITMKLMSLELKDGLIPSPEHLEEVKTCLVRIQNVLIQILRFWNHVAEILQKLEQQTFSGKELMDDLADFKEIFLDSITAAEQAWKAFGQSCMIAQEMFDIQARDAYKFLETNPASLSEEEKQKQRDAVNEKLKEICQEPESEGIGHEPESAEPPAALPASDDTE